MAREYYDTMKRSAAQHSREDRACDACADVVAETPSPAGIIAQRAASGPRPEWGSHGIDAGVATVPRRRCGRPAGQAAAGGDGALPGGPHPGGHPGGGRARADGGAAAIARACAGRPGIVRRGRRGPHQGRVGGNLRVPRDALRGAEEGGICGGARRVVAIFGGVADPRGDDGGE